MLPSFTPRIQATAPTGAYVLSIQKPVENNNASILTHYSDNTARLYSLSNTQFNQTNSYTIPNLSNVCFVNENTSTIAATSKTGSIYLFDTRSNSNTPSLKIDSPSNLPYACLTVNNNGTILAAGTDLVKPDSYIQLFDLRNASTTPTIEYIDSHSDDITTLLFHPLYPTVLISGSTDGLMNVFQVNETTEDDALQYTFTPDSVSKIGVFGHDYVYVLSHIETLSIWSLKTGDPIVELGDVRQFTGGSESGVLDYAIRCVFDDAEGRLYLVGGNQGGELSAYHVNMEALQPIPNIFGKTKNNGIMGHSDIVRDVCMDLSTGLCVSGGEDGNLIAWKSIPM